MLTAMEIREITNKNEWEGFLAGCRDKTFLQSWNWGEFQEIMRGKIWRLGFFENNALAAVALVVKVAAKRGRFLLVPHGPVVKISNSQFPISNQFSNLTSPILQTLLKKLKELAREEGAGFIRINPIWERTPENEQVFRDFGFRQAPIQMHPEASWKLDITLPEDELLASMRKTTRYCIRQATKNADLEVVQSTELGDVALFSELHKQVSVRQHFTPFSLEYLQNEFSVFHKDNEIVLFLGRYKGEVAAASFVVFWSGIGFYHHAASLSQFAKLSVPYRLQWEAIQEAQRRGCKLYDFWGYVNPETQPQHPWAGPTLFKMGFGGKAYEYVKTQDFPLRFSYWPTALFEEIRKLRRHL